MYTDCSYVASGAPYAEGYYDNKKVAHDIIPKMQEWGLAAVTLHGRSRQQRYSRLADWAYVKVGCC